MVLIVDHASRTLTRRSKEYYVTQQLIFHLIEHQKYKAPDMPRGFVGAEERLAGESLLRIFTKPRCNLCLYRTYFYEWPWRCHDRTSILQDTFKYMYVINKTLNLFHNFKAMYIEISDIWIQNQSLCFSSGLCKTIIWHCYITLNVLVLASKKLWVLHTSYFRNRVIGNNKQWHIMWMD